MSVNKGTQSTDFDLKKVGNHSISHQLSTILINAISNKNIFALNTTVVKKSKINLDLIIFNFTTQHKY